jgi:hypothetical protein
MANGEWRMLIVALCTMALGLMACEPLPTYEVNDVHITSQTRIISSGFIEQVFTTDRDAYYLIGIEQVQEGYDPTKPELQKPFMTLELDSAHQEYLDWRRELLRQGEFTIASFASHSLQYGETDYFFTGLKRNTDYWIYAFVVDPEKMVPKGKLNLVKVTTTENSTVDVHFEYRIMDDWDYIYPMDSTGAMVTHYPYVMETVDSLDIVASGAYCPQYYFSDRQAYWTANPDSAHLLYGVYTRQNIEVDDANEQELFEELDYNCFSIGHTYYTFICGFDDGYFHPTIYKFRWEGNNTKYYFNGKDGTNLFDYIDRW